MKAGRIFKMVILVLVIILGYELAGILAAYGHQPPISEKTKKETDMERFYDTAKSPERASVVEANADGLLQRVRLIQNAQEDIVLSTFAFHSDDSGKIVIGALLDAAERGVRVRILADGFESWTAMERNPYFYALSSHKNVEIKLYNRANPLKPWKLMGRMHDKYLIADTQTYLLGGRNTYNYFLGDFPGHKNYDRDMLVYCEEPQEGSSVRQLEQYFETVWNYDASKLFHENEKLQKKKSVKEAALDATACYTAYFEENQEKICDSDYAKDTFETEKIAFIANPIHTKVKEPSAWYEMAELMKRAEKRVSIHTPYIICNDMMYDTWEEIAKSVPEFSVMTNSAANNGNPFGSADYVKNKERILGTGVDIWEYEGGYSYHGKSILIDDDISIVGSYNMDMRSAYLDTELMLFVRSKEVNAQLEKNMKEYEQKAILYKSDGSRENPYHTEAVAFTKKRQRRVFLVKNFLGWARFLF